MDGIKKNLKRKIRSSSLVEVLVSMVIILAVFGIAMRIYTNILRSSLSVKRYHAQMVLNQTLNEVENRPEIGNRIIKIKQFLINEQITNYQDQPRLIEINLTASDENQALLGELKKIIYVHQKN